MANNFFVSYDLMKNKDYKKLIAELEELGGVPLLKSFWYVSLDNTVSEVMAHLRTFVDGDDKLFIVDASKNTWSALRIESTAIRDLKAQWNRSK